MRIAISAETTIDLPKEMLEEFDIHTVAFQILLGDESKLDGEITCDEIIDFVTRTKILPKTGAVNEYQFTEHFEKLLSSYDKVIHFSLSSEMSSACQNAKSAAEKLGNVCVIDTRSLSTGIALLAINASKLVKEGKSFEQIVEISQKRVKNVQTSFVLERLDYLYKGGRCSSLAYFGANLLKLKPQIVVNDGKMGAAKKYRGSIENVVKQYSIDTLEKHDNPDLSLVFLTYTTATEKMLSNVMEILKNRGFKDIRVTRAGGTITSHCGEHCLGILYINDGGKY